MTQREELLSNIGKAYEAKMDELGIFPHYPTDELLKVIESEFETASVGLIDK